MSEESFERQYEQVLAKYNRFICNVKTCMSETIQRLTNNDVEQCKYQQALEKYKLLIDNVKACMMETIQRLTYNNVEQCKLAVDNANQNKNQTEQLVKREMLK